MSNFYIMAYCVKCKTTTRHLCADDTPTRHRYTVSCEACGTRWLEDVSFPELMAEIGKGVSGAEDQQS